MREARHDWIACTDAGCRPVSGWLRALKDARERGEIAAGTSSSRPRRRSTRGGLRALPRDDEIEEPTPAVRLAHRLFGRDFRPEHAGGRSMAFSRAAWDAVGGFPEYVYAGEDFAFSAAAIERGFRPTLAEDATVRWRPRTTWGETARMFAAYTRGDIRTKGSKRMRPDLAAWTIGPALVVKSGTPGRVLAAAGAAAYVWLPMRRARRTLPLAEWWRIPVLVALKDLSQLAGAALGVIDETRNLDQPRPHR